MVTKSRKFKREKKSKDQDLIFSVLLTLFLLGAAAFLIVSNLKIQKRRGELKLRISQLEQEIQTLEAKNEELRKGIENISDQEYLEKVAREKFLLKEPGEEVIVVRPPEEGEETKQEKPSLWEKVLKKLEFLRR